MKKFFTFTSARVALLLSVLTLSPPALAGTACNATLMQGSFEQRSLTHASVYTSILIDAAPEQVWDTLTDFDVMSDWSTGTLQGITGDIRDGGRVTITFLFGQDENGNPIANEISHTLSYEEGISFGWSDPFPADIGGGHDDHLYKVQACGTQTLFIQSDEIVGNPYAANFVTQLLPLYQQFNADLKSIVEN